MVVRGSLQEFAESHGCLVLFALLKQTPSPMFVAEYIAETLQ